MDGVEVEDEDADAVLLRRAGAGDGLALDELFHRHLPALKARVRRVVPPAVRRRVSISDIVQEARIVACRRAASFEAEPGEAACRNWLLQIVEYKAREALRTHVGTAKRDARRDIPSGARPDTREFAAVGPSPSADAMATEARETVEAALLALSDVHRQVLRWARIEHRTLGEIAERLGRSREAAKKLYARALARFTEVLRSAREGFDE